MFDEEYNGPERRREERRSGRDRRETLYIDVKHWDPDIEKQRNKKRRMGIDRRGLWATI